MVQKEDDSLRRDTITSETEDRLNGLIHIWSI